MSPEDPEPAGLARRPFPSSRAAPRRGIRAARAAAEGPVDRRGLPRESPQVFVPPWCLALSAAQLELQRQQLTDQSQALGLRHFGQLIVDRRAKATPPVDLEPVARRVDPSGVRQ
jgi:hypothetical protein